jgi:hypothetical protein
MTNNDAADSVLIPVRLFAGLEDRREQETRDIAEALYELGRQTAMGREERVLGLMVASR